MPWPSGKITERKIMERKNGPIQIHRKNGFGVRFTGSAPATARPPDRQERLNGRPAERLPFLFCEFGPSSRVNCVTRPQNGGFIPIV